MQGTAPPVSKRSSSSSFPSPKRMKTTKLEKPPPGFFEIVDLADDEDEFLLTPISKQGSTKKTAICVEQCSDDRDLDSAIMASLNSSKGSNFIDLSHDYLFLDDDVRLLSFKPVSTSFGKRQKPNFQGSVTGIASSSNSKNDPDAFCEICIEPMKKNEFFSIQGCTHAYCTDCMVKYVASKLQENITNIRCPVPGCVGLLEPEHCHSILPQDVFDRWGDALCEAMILGSQRFYCPFKDCSAMLIDDGETAVRESECPNCRRMFCAQCKVAWHAGIECEEFQTLNKDEREMEDIMLMNLAQSKKWRRCPSCRMFVSKSQGCKHMICRCGTFFCYRCGSTKHAHSCRRAKKIGSLPGVQEANRTQQVSMMQEVSWMPETMSSMQGFSRMQEMDWMPEVSRTPEVRMPEARMMREVRMQEVSRMPEARRMREVRMQEVSGTRVARSMREVSSATDMINPTLH